MTAERLAARGLILQPTYRTLNGRPVPFYWGRLEDGRTFLARLPGGESPHFWVPAAAAGHPVLEGRSSVRPARRQAMDGADLVRVEVRRPQDVPPLRDRLLSAGVATYEADVRFALRPLIDRGVRGVVELSGDALDARTAAGDLKVDLLFEDPAMSAVPADEAVHVPLRLLSLDIETNWRSGEVLSVGLAGSGFDEVWVRSPPGESTEQYLGEAAREQLDFDLHVTSDERQLLERVARRIVELDPDVITGWSVIDFDFKVLLERSQRLGVAFEIGRSPGAVTLRRGLGPRQASQLQIPGRVALDGPNLLRGSFITMERWSLDFVAHQVLGEGKTLTGQRAETIVAWWQGTEQERVDLLRYNLVDCQLVLGILEKLDLVELSVARSRMTGMPIDRVSSSIAAFDFLYLEELGRRDLAAPSVRRDRVAGTVGGGAVLPSTPGLHDFVAVFDFRSLYPSLIRTFQIDPLGYVDGRRVGQEPEGDLIRAPNGAHFRRAGSGSAGVLPGMLDELFPMRAAAKATGDHTRSTAIKILMNSFFGVLGAPSCRFFNLEISNGITSFGRELLTWCRDRAEQAGHRVLYGDTDSLFVSTGVRRGDGGDLERARQRCAEIVDWLNAELTAHVEATWGVPSKLELEWEKLYLRLFLPALRSRGGGEEGAAKKYVGLLDRGDEAEPEVVFTGLEAVRRDWTDLARRVQRALYARLFADEPVDELLELEAKALRAGERDGELVYTKGLRKPLDEYEANAPHVVAARLRDPERADSSEGKGNRDLIRYLITTEGPQPHGQRTAPLDYEHYLEKQVRPIAEPVLRLLDLDFKRVIGDDTQMLLF